MPATDVILMIVAPEDALDAIVVLTEFPVDRAVVSPEPDLIANPLSNPATVTLPDIFPVKLPLIFPETVILFVLIFGTNKLKLPVSYLKKSGSELST